MSVQTYRLSISGMSCAGCVSTVEQSLNKVQGVEQANVNFAEHTDSVNILENYNVSVEELVCVVVEAGDITQQN